jgi:hypothetical protein
VPARLFVLLAGLAAVVASLMSIPAATAPPRDPWFDQPDAALWYAEQRRAPSRPIDTAALYDQAAGRMNGMRRFSSRIARTLPAGQKPSRLWLGAEAAGVLDAWTPLGPGNIGGRTRIIRFHPSSHSILFAAGVSGGIWKSDDSGRSWRPIADGLTNLAVNSFVIDPRAPERMYAGTGEGYFREEIRGTGLPLRGGGIFLTQDGGARWTRLPSTQGSDFHWVNDLEMSRSDGRRLYAATRTGVWRSTDGGDTWTRLLATEVRGGCLDLALRTDDPRDVLFASCGSYEQATVYRFPRAAHDSRPEIVLRQPGMGRTSLAIAPSHQDVMYALSASNDPGPRNAYRQGLLALYRSVGGGQAGSWEARVRNTHPVKLFTLLLTNVSGATDTDCSTNSSARDSYTNMGWYVNALGVDPRDPNRVWAGGVDWFRSDDGGRSWGLTSSTGVMRTPTQSPVHVDQHAIAFHPAYDGRDNQTVLVANDGGIFRSNSARGRAATGPRASCRPVSMDVRWESLNRGLGVTQFYHGIPFPDGERYFGGTQDNGTILGTDETGGDGWQPIFGGDGGYVAVDPTDTRTLYLETQWANIVKSVDGGSRFVRATRGLDPVMSDNLGPDANFLFVTPLVMDPANTQRLWTGGDFIYRTDDGAAQWTKASAVLPGGGLVSAIAVGPGDGNTVAIGTSKGDILVNGRALQTAAGSVWPGSRPRDGWVTSVAFAPDDTGIIYATYGNFGGEHVFRSTDGGLSWRSIDGSDADGLPDIPVHSIVVDPDDPERLYLGTDIGVLVSIEGGQRWMVEETGFGAAVTEWLTLIRDTSGRKRLFAFTHGRGVWRVDVR